MAKFILVEVGVEVGWGLKEEFKIHLYNSDVENIYTIREKIVKEFFLMISEFSISFQFI